MADLKAHQHRLFLHPEKGWTPDPDGAIRRLDARVRRRLISEPVNAVYEHGPDGWRPVPSLNALSAVERGWVFYGHRTTVKGRPYLALKGVSVIDEHSASLLDGLHPADIDGAPLDAAVDAGHQFLLSPDEASTFASRLKGAGGQLLRAAAIPDAAEQALATIELYGFEMEELADADRRFVADAREQEFTELGAFQARGDEMRDKLSSASEAFAECERAIGPLMVSGRSPEDLAKGEALRHSAREALGRCEVLMEARANDEQLIRQLVARRDGLIDHKPAAARLLLFRALGQEAAQQGLTVEETPDGVRIHTDRGWLRLGPGLEFE